MISTNKSLRYYELGAQAILKDKHNRAKKWLQIAKFYGHPSNDIYYQYGIISFKELNLSDAIHNFHLYISSKNKSDYDVFYYLAESYVLLGGKDEAIRNYKKIIEESSDVLLQCKSLFSLKILKYYSQSTIEQIVQKKFNFMLDIQSKVLENLRINALIYALNDQYDNAIEILYKIIHLSPNLIEAYKELIECLFATKQYINIIRIFNDCKPLLKKDRTLIYYYAKASYLLNNFSEAKKGLLYVIRHIPSNGKFFYNLANIYYKLNKHNKAAKYYFKAIQYDKDFYICYYNIGVIYQKAGLVDLSEENYLKSKEFTDSYYPVDYNLGILYFQKKDYNKSLNSFLETCEQNQSDLKAKHNFNAVKNIKLVDAENKDNKSLVSVTNIYLFIIAGLLFIIYLLLR